MAKKTESRHKSATGAATFSKIESSPYFVPAVILLFLLALVILFSDFVFSDKMLDGSDTLIAGYFFRSFYVDYVLEHGAVPQWNPYIWGGLPFIEAFHGDIFYPLSAIKFFGELKRMLGWILFWHIFLAGLTMYFTARQFRLSRLASLVSAACYMFAGYLVSFVSPGHDGKIFVTTLFPLTMLFLDRGFERRPFLNFSLLGLVIGVIILAPHPQMSYFMLWAVSLYAAFKLIVMLKAKKPFGRLVKLSSLTTYAVVLGLLLSAIQFYPGYYYTSHFSPRAETKQGWDWATSWSLHEEEAASLLIPEFSGTKSDKTRTFYWGKNAFKDNSETLGIVALFLALIGAFFSRRKEAWFFAGLGLFALSYALASTTPLFKLYFYLIPKVSSMRSASMIVFLFSFAVALLAGMAVQYIRESIKEGGVSKRFNYLLFGLPSFMAFLALAFGVSGRGMLNLWCDLFYSKASTTFVQQGVTKFDVAMANLPAIQSGAWIAFFFSAVVALLVWMYLNKKAGPWVLALLVLLPVIDGVRFNSRFVGTVDDATFQQRFGDNQLISLLKSKPDKFRLMNIMSDQDNSFPYHRIEVPTGYHGNQLSWYDNLVGDLSRANRNSPGFLNLMGARYLIGPAGQSVPEGYFGAKPVVQEADLGQAVLLRNENALPRVFLADSFKVVADRKLIYAEVVKSREDLSKVVILEEPPDLALTVDTNGTDSVWIVHYGVDSIEIGANCSANKILVLTDVYFDAWKVFVDRNEAKLLRSYGALRAVAIPAGTQRVTFKYESERYQTGKLVTQATSVYLFGIFAFYLLWWYKGRGKKGKSEE